MKYSIGDNVKIKSWDTMVEEYGLIDEGCIDVPGFWKYGKRKESYVKRHNRIINIGSFCPCSPQGYENSKDTNAWVFTDEMIECKVGKEEKQISESIFSDKNVIIPMADVQHIERHFYNYNSADGTVKKGDICGCFIITKHTKWNFENDTWENAIYLSKECMDSFMKAWCYYRYEYEGLKNKEK
jgi:hypothetical protein